MFAVPYAVQAIYAEYELLDEEEKVYKLQKELEAQVCDALMLSVNFSMRKRQFTSFRKSLISKRRLFLRIRICRG